MNQTYVRDLMLISAFKLFASKPYDKVTIKEIEKSINHSRGAIFYYIKNKEALFIEVCDKYMFFNSIPSFEKEFPCISDFFDAFIEWIEHERERLRKYNLNNLNLAHVHLTNQAITYYPGFIEKAKVWQSYFLELFYNNLHRAKVNKEISENADIKFVSTLLYNVYCGVSYNGIVLPYGIDNVELKKYFNYIINNPTQ